MMAHFPPFYVIDDQFITREPLEIIVDKYPCRSMVITDINHKILLKVKPHDKTFHRQRVLLDANDKPIAKLRDKNLTMHDRWNAFKGDSKSDSDMLFTTKKEHALFQFKVNVRLTLTNKKIKNNNCDLRIKGSWSKGNCAVYIGDSKTVIAQMNKPETLKYANTEKFTVTIQPNIDYACVVALFVIVDAMENPDEVKQGSGAVGAALNVLDIAGAVASNN